VAVVADWQSQDNYVLLTFTKNPSKMVVEIKGLDGKVLDRKQFDKIEQQLKQ